MVQLTCNSKKIFLQLTGKAKRHGSTKKNTNYYDNDMKPDQYRLLTFQVPNLISTFCCSEESHNLITRRTMVQIMQEIKSLNYNQQFILVTLSRHYNIVRILFYT